MLAFCFLSEQIPKFCDNTNLPGHVENICKEMKKKKCFTRANAAGRYGLGLEEDTTLSARVRRKETASSKLKLTVVFSMRNCEYSSPLSPTPRQC